MYSSKRSGSQTGQKGNLTILHPQIANHRHEEAHKTITFQESLVCLKVIELCNEKNIAVLPIHDSFVVKKRHRDALEALMAKAYELLDFQSVPMATDE